MILVPLGPAQRKEEGGRVRRRRKGRRRGQKQNNTTKKHTSEDSINTVHQRHQLERERERGRWYLQTERERDGGRKPARGVEVGERAGERGRSRRQQLQKKQRKQRRESFITLFSFPLSCSFSWTPSCSAFLALWEQLLYCSVSLADCKKVRETLEDDSACKTYSTTHTHTHILYMHICSKCISTHTHTHPTLKPRLSRRKTVCGLNIDALTMIRWATLRVWGRDIVLGFGTQRSYSDDGQRLWGGCERQTGKREMGGLRGAMDLSSPGPSGPSARGWDQRHCSPSLCSPCHRYTSPHYCRSTREKDENQV